MLLGLESAILASIFLLQISKTETDYDELGQVQDIRETLYCHKEDVELLVLNYPTNIFENHTYEIIVSSSLDTTMLTATVVQRDDAYQSSDCDQVNNYTYLKQNQSFLWKPSYTGKDKAALQFHVFDDNGKSTDVLLPLVSFCNANDTIDYFDEVNPFDKVPFWRGVFINGFILRDNFDWGTFDEIISAMWKRTEGFQTSAKCGKISNSKAAVFCSKTPRVLESQELNLKDADEIIFTTRLCHHSNTTIPNVRLTFKNENQNWTELESINVTASTQTIRITIPETVKTRTAQLKLTDTQSNSCWALDNFIVSKQQNYSKYLKEEFKPMHVKLWSSTGNYDIQYAKGKNYLYFQGNDDEPLSTSPLDLESESANSVNVIEEKELDSPRWSKSNCNECLQYLCRSAINFNEIGFAQFGVTAEGTDDVSNKKFKYSVDVEAQYYEEIATSPNKKSFLLKKIFHPGNYSFAINSYSRNGKLCWRSLLNNWKLTYVKLFPRYTEGANTFLQFETLRMYPESNFKDIEIEFSINKGLSWEKLSSVDLQSVDSLKNDWTRYTIPLLTNVMTAQTSFRWKLTTPTAKLGITNIFIGHCLKGCYGRGRCSIRGCICDEPYLPPYCEMKTEPEENYFIEEFEKKSDQIEITGNVSLGYECDILHEGRSAVIKEPDAVLKVGPINALYASALEVTVSLSGCGIHQPRTVLVYYSCHGNLKEALTSFYAGDGLPLESVRILHLPNAAKCSRLYLHFYSKGDGVWAIDSVSNEIKNVLTMKNVYAMRSLQKIHYSSNDLSSNLQQVHSSTVSLRLGYVITAAFESISDKIDFYYRHDTQNSAWSRLSIPPSFGYFPHQTLFVLYYPITTEMRANKVELKIEWEEGNKLINFYVGPPCPYNCFLNGICTNSTCKFVSNSETNESLGTQNKFRMDVNKNYKAYFTIFKNIAISNALDMVNTRGVLIYVVGPINGSVWIDISEDSGIKWTFLSLREITSDTRLYLPLKSHIMSQKVNIRMISDCFVNKGSIILKSFLLKEQLKDHLHYTSKKINSDNSVGIVDDVQGRQYIVMLLSSVILNCDWQNILFYEIKSFGNYGVHLEMSLDNGETWNYFPSPLCLHPRNCQRHYNTGTFIATGQDSMCSDVPTSLCDMELSLRAVSQNNFTLEEFFIGPKRSEIWRNLTKGRNGFFLKKTVITSTVIEKFEENKLNTTIWKVNYGHITTDCGKRRSLSTKYLCFSESRTDKYAMAGPFSNLSYISFKFSLQEICDSNSSVALEYSTDRGFTWMILETMNYKKQVVAPVPSSVIYFRWRELNDPEEDRQSCLIWNMRNVIFRSFEKNSGTVQWIFQPIDRTTACLSEKTGAINIYRDNPTTLDMYIEPFSVIQFHPVSCNKRVNLAVKCSMDFGITWTDIRALCDSSQSCSAQTIFTSERIIFILPKQLYWNRVMFQWESKKDVKWTLENVFIGNTCENLCHGHGHCVETGCNCDDGYFGKFCEKSYKTTQTQVRFPRWIKTSSAIYCPTGFMHIAFQETGKQRKYLQSMATNIMEVKYIEILVLTEMLHNNSHAAINVLYSEDRKITWRLLAVIRHFNHFIIVQIPPKYRSQEAYFRIISRKGGLMWCLQYFRLIRASANRMISTNFMSNSSLNEDNILFNHGMLQRRNQTQIIATAGFNSMQSSMRTTEVIFDDKTVLQYELNLKINDNGEACVFAEISSDFGLSWSRITRSLFTLQPFIEFFPDPRFCFTQNVTFRYSIPLYLLGLNGPSRIKFSASARDVDIQWKIENLYLGPLCPEMCGLNGYCLDGVRCKCPEENDDIFCRENLTESWNAAYQFENMKVFGPLDLSMKKSVEFHIKPCESDVMLSYTMNWGASWTVIYDAFASNNCYHVVNIPAQAKRKNILLQWSGNFTVEQVAFSSFPYHRTWHYESSDCTDSNSAVILSKGDHACRNVSSCFSVVMNATLNDTRLIITDDFSLKDSAIIQVKFTNLPPFNDVCEGVSTEFSKDDGRKWTSLKNNEDRNAVLISTVWHTYTFTLPKEAMLQQMWLPDTWMTILFAFIRIVERIVQDLLSTFHSSMTTRFRFSSNSRIFWAIEKFYVGNSCVNQCHGHGVCNGTSCLCDDGYYGEYCEKANDTITFKTRMNFKPEHAWINCLDTFSRKIICDKCEAETKYYGITNSDKLVFSPEKKADSTSIDFHLYSRFLGEVQWKPVASFYTRKHSTFNLSPGKQQFRVIFNDISDFESIQLVHVQNRFLCTNMSDIPSHVVDVRCRPNYVIQTEQPIMYSLNFGETFSLLRTYGLERTTVYLSDICNAGTVSIKKLTNDNRFLYVGPKCSKNCYNLGRCTFGYCNCTTTLTQTCIPVVKMNEPLRWIFPNTSSAVSDVVEIDGHNIGTKAISSFIDPLKCRSWKIRIMPKFPNATLPLFQIDYSEDGGTSWYFASIAKISNNRAEIHIPLHLNELVQIRVSQVERSLLNWFLGATIEKGQPQINPSRVHEHFAYQDQTNAWETIEGCRVSPGLCGSHRSSLHCTGNLSIVRAMPVIIQENSTLSFRFSFNCKPQVLCEESSNAWLEYSLPTQKDTWLKLTSLKEALCQTKLLINGGSSWWYNFVTVLDKDTHSHATRFQFVSSSSWTLHEFHIDECPYHCSKRGDCIYGVCKCFETFYGEWCQYANLTIPSSLNVSFDDLSEIIKVSEGVKIGSLACPVVEVTEKNVAHVRGCGCQHIVFRELNATDITIIKFGFLIYNSSDSDDCLPVSSSALKVVLDWTDNQGIIWNKLKVLDLNDSQKMIVIRLPQRARKEHIHFRFIQISDSAAHLAWAIDSLSTE